METEQLSQPPFTKEYLNSLYDYKDGELFFKNGERAHASTENKKWYVKMTVDGVRYGVHRLVLFYHTGQWGDNGYHVDHVDGNIHNNAIENLRLVTAATNIRKGKVRANNTTGVTGVSWSKAAHKYMVQIRDHRKHVYLGLFEDLDKAAEAVLQGKMKIEERKYNDKKLSTS